MFKLAPLLIPQCLLVQLRVMQQHDTVGGKESYLAYKLLLSLRYPDSSAQRACGHKPSLVL